MSNQPFDAPNDRPWQAGITSYTEPADPDPSDPDAPDDDSPVDQHLVDATIAALCANSARYQEDEDAPDPDPDPTPTTPLEAYVPRQRNAQEQAHAALRRATFAPEAVKAHRARPHDRYYLGLPPEQSSAGFRAPLTWPEDADAYLLICAPGKDPETYLLTDNGMVPYRGELLTPGEARRLHPRQRASGLIDRLAEWGDVFFSDPVASRLTLAVFGFVAVMVGWLVWLHGVAGVGQPGWPGWSAR